MTTVIEPSYRKRIGYQGGLLGMFATLAATLLVAGNVATYDVIEQRKAEDLQYSLGQVIPDSIHDNNLLDDKLVLQHQGKDVVVYRGLKGPEVEAVAYGVQEQGYGGEISMIMGVNRDGELLGVRILSHTETPGLGDRIEVEKDDWVYSFDGLSFEKLPEKKWAVRKTAAFSTSSAGRLSLHALLSEQSSKVSFFSANTRQHCWQENISNRLMTTGWRFLLPRRNDHAA